MSGPVLGRAPSLSWCWTILQATPLGRPYRPRLTGVGSESKKFSYSGCAGLNRPPPRAHKRQDSSIACSSGRRRSQPTCPTQIGWLATEGAKGHDCEFGNCV